MGQYYMPTLIAKDRTISTLNNFCFSHDMIKNDCKKCPFHKYEAYPLAGLLSTIVDIL